MPARQAACFSSFASDGNPAAPSTLDAGAFEASAERGEKEKSMKTQKSNEKKQKKNMNTKVVDVENLAEAAAWKRFTMRPEGQLDPADYAIPVVTLERLIGLAYALVPNAPLVLAPRVEKALMAMGEGAGLARGVKRFRIQTGPRRTKAPRNETVSLLASVLGQLDGLAESRWVEAAERAVRVRRDVFGEGLEVLKLGPWELWTEVCDARVELERRPDLKAELQELVPMGLVERLFEKNDALGEVVGMTGGGRGRLPFNGFEVAGFLRRTIAQYVLQVLATAEESLEGVMAARAALEPLTVLRADVARRRAPAAANDEAEEDVDAFDAPPAPEADAEEEGDG